MSQGGPAGTPSSAEGIGCRPSTGWLHLDCEELALRELRILQRPDLAHNRGAGMIANTSCHCASWAPVFTDELRVACKTPEFQAVTLAAELLRRYTSLSKSLARCLSAAAGTVVGHHLESLLAQLWL